MATGAATTVTFVVLKVLAQPPAAAIVLVTVYKPAVEADKSMIPEAGVIDKPTLLVKVPKLAPPPKTGLGSTPAVQYETAP